MNVSTKFVLCHVDRSVSFVTDEKFRSMSTSSTIVARGLADEVSKEIAIIDGNADVARRMVGSEYEVF